MRSPGEESLADSLWPRAALGLALAGTLAILWSAFCTVPSFYWNPPRLAPAFALAEGLNIYATRASAAHLGWHYGPVFPLFSLPATLASNLTAAFWIWSGLNLLAICGPAWLVLRETLGARRAAWAGLVFYLTLLLGNEITQSMVFAIHIDALCIGWGTLACWCVYRATRETARDRFLHGAALGVALAVGTKQVAVTLIPALLTWLWWHDHRALAGRLLLRIAAYGGGLAVLCFLWFGGEELLFNMWLIHARMPRWGGLGMVGHEALRMLTTGWVWLAAALFAWYFARGRGAHAPARPALGDLLLWVAGFHLPLGLWAVTKTLGGLNSVHAINYFLLVVAGWLTRLAADENEGAAARRWLRGAVVCAVVVCALGSAFIGVFLRGACWTPYRGQEDMLRLARANAGRMYFPWNPLLTILTDKKVYPFDNALFCLSIAGLEPPPEKIRAALPANVVLFYQEPVQGKFALKYFPPQSSSAPLPPPKP